MEYFTYAAKNEKPYKAVLLGLDKSDPSVIKAHLLKLGLKVMDVKKKTNKLYLLFTLKKINYSKRIKAKILSYELH